MAIKTAKSTAEDLKEKLSAAETIKEKLLKTITKPGFLEYAPLEKEEFENALSMIAEALDSMYDPIRRQKKRIAVEQHKLSQANQAKLDEIKTELDNQLKHIPLIKEAIENKDAVKIRDGLISLKKEVSDCIKSIKEIS